LWIMTALGIAFLPPLGWKQHVENEQYVLVAGRLSRLPDHMDLSRLLRTTPSNILPGHEGRVLEAAELS